MTTETMNSAKAAQAAETENHIAELTCKVLDILREVCEGKNLDKHINHPSEFIRSAVAEQGFGLDRLINDPDWTVRSAVARKRHGLDVLVNDPDWHVRAAVAAQDFDIADLILDPEPNVRKATVPFAEEGHLIGLIADPDLYVRHAAEAKMQHDLIIEYFKLNDTASVYTVADKPGMLVYIAHGDSECKLYSTAKECFEQILLPVLEQASANTFSDTFNDSQLDYLAERYPQLASTIEEFFEPYPLTPPQELMEKLAASTEHREDCPPAN